MSCSDSCTHEPMDKVVHIYHREITLVKEKANGHSCRSVSKAGEEITHTKEMDDGRLFLNNPSGYPGFYYQINNCPFCGFKAKQQII